MFCQMFLLQSSIEGDQEESSLKVIILHFINVRFSAKLMFSKRLLCCNPLFWKAYIALICFIKLENNQLVPNKFQTKENATEIHKIVCDRWSKKKFAVWPFFINIHISCHLKLEFVSAIPASNDEK